MSGFKVVLITGANKGLGYQTVKALLGSATKYHIFLGSRDLAKGQKAADALRSEVESLSVVDPIQLDIQSDDSIQNAFETVKSKVGRVDALVNNAGT